MGKRAATKAIAPKAKAPKNSVIMPVPVDVDPVAEEYTPVFNLLSDVLDIPEPCISMLRAVTPHCLGTDKESRHDYQNTMVAVLEKTMKTVEDKYVAAIVAFQTQIAQVGAKKASHVENLEGLATQIDTIENTIREKISALNEATEGVASAKATLGHEQESQNNQLVLNAQRSLELTEFEQLYSETWQSLKSGTIPPKDWRLRNKAIDTIVKAFTKVGIDKSLSSALPTALKLKPAERGPFAQATIEFGEETFTAHIADLKERIANNDTEAAERAQAVAAAEAAALGAEKNMGEKSADLETTKELLKATKKTRDEAALQVKAADAHIEEFTKAINCEQEGLDRAQELLAEFYGMKERDAAKEAENEEEEGATEAMEK